MIIGGIDSESEDAVDDDFDTASPENDARISPVHSIESRWTRSKVESAESSSKDHTSVKLSKSFRGNNEIETDSFSKDERLGDKKVTFPSTRSKKVYCLCKASPNGEYLPCQQGRTDSCNGFVHLECIRQPLTEALLNRFLNDDYVCSLCEAKIKEESKSSKSTKRSPKAALDPKVNELNERVSAVSKRVILKPKHLRDDD